MKRALSLAAFILAFRIHVVWAGCPVGCVDRGTAKLPDGRVVTVCDCRKPKDPPPKTAQQAGHPSANQPRVL